jgi:hypothetical protein
MGMVYPSRESAGPTSAAPNSKAVDGFSGRTLRPAGLSCFSGIGILVTPFLEVIDPVMGLVLFLSLTSF